MTEKIITDNLIIDNWIIGIIFKGVNMSVRDTAIDERLLQSAKKEFLKHGFLKADLKNICDQAGVTTGAVYKRYKGKEELFMAVVSKAVEKMDSFVELRSEYDFTNLSDSAVRETWVMNKEYTLDMFKMMWDIRDELILLVEKSAGTVYENYEHDFSLKMTKAYMQFYNEAKKRDIASIEISEKEMHVLCTAFWSSIYEPFIHKMTWKEIENHCDLVCRYFNWYKALGID